MSQEKSNIKICEFLRIVSFAGFVSMLLLPDVGIAGLYEVTIAEQPQSQQATDAAAKRSFVDSFSENIVRKVSASANNTSLRLQLVQSPATKPAPSPIQLLINKASQLFKEGYELSKQPSVAAQRQAISKYEEILKIWRLPEVRAEIPEKARSYEADILFHIGYIYSVELTEYTKAVGYMEQALAISRESKEPKARSTQGLALLGLGGVYRELGEKQKAVNAYTQAQSLYHAENQPKVEAQALSGIAGVYGRFGEQKKEREFLDKALAIHKANKDLPEQASTLTLIALNCQKLDETENALKYYLQALEIYRQTKDLFEQANTLIAIGFVYSTRGARLSAEKYIQQALELQKTVLRQLQQNVEYQRNQIIILQQIATSYSALGDTQQQIVYLKQAETIAHELGRTQDEAQVISNIGEAYYNLGETQKSLENLNQALKLQRDIKDFQGEAKTLVNIASIHTKSGESQQALNKLNEALEISKQKQNSVLEGEILYDMSGVYGNLGAYDLSIQKTKEVLAIYQKSNPGLVGTAHNSIGSAYLQSCFYQKKPEDCSQGLDYFKQALDYARKKDSVSMQASILGNIAKAYELLKDYPQAITNAKQALELSRKYKLKDIEKTALGLLSAAYERAGDHQNALDVSKQSLSLSQQLGDLTSQATVYKIQGTIYTSMKQPQQAIEAYHQELKLAKQIGDTSNQTYPLYKIAIIERDRGNLNQAKTQIETAIKLIESIRGKVTSQDLRTSYFATVQDYYEFYIDLLMQLHKQNPSQGYDALALHVSERSRARGLVELLAEAGANIRKLATEQLLLNKIDATQKRIQELPAKPNNETRIEALKKESENLLTEYRELQTKIRTTSPEYAAIQYPEPLELKQIQQQLDKDTVLLQYSLGKDRSYVWAVTPDSLQAYELPAQKQIEDAANNFRDAMLSGATPFGKNNPDAINKPASQLSQIILAPLANKLEKKRLLIVADGVLQNIPFAALADPSATSVTKSVAYQPLIVNHEIVNLPSVTAIATQRKLNKRQLATKTLAVIADPVFSANDERVTGKPDSLGKELILDSSLRRAMKNLKRNELSRLPGTRKEAEAILKLVPPSQSLHVYDFDANYNFATNPQLKQYRFLLFATHGIVDTTNPELSGIALTQIDKQGKAVEKGYLRLGDIFNLDLGAELVVLSACETGLGKNVKGEGLMGLTRGLMYAGSKRAVVSLWQVDDDGTSQLMPLFYKAVLAGKSPTVALREAQLQLWQQKEWQNPYYWAPFTLQGEWR